MAQFRIPDPVRRWLPRLWLALLVAYILAGVDAVPFHGDESTTIWMSRDYHYITAGDFARVQYHDAPTDPVIIEEQFLRFVAAPLTRYLYGFAGQVIGYDAPSINEQWVWGAGWDWNLERGTYPPDDLLLATRLVSAGFTAAAAVVLFLIARRLAFGIPGGALLPYLTTLYFVLNPAVLLNGRRAMMEGPNLFFGLLAVLAGILLLQKRTWWAALLLGVSAGLAVAAKHTNLVIVGAVFAACGLVAIWDSLRDESDEDDIDPATVGPTDSYFLLVTLTVAGTLAVFVFYALNPVMWDAPVERIGDIVDRRGQVIDAQIAAFTVYDSVPDRIAGWMRQTFVVVPQYFEAPTWVGFIDGEITAYEATGWAGVSVGGAVTGGVIVAALLLVGLWSLASAGLRIETRLLVVVWATLVILVPLFAYPFEWQRYYLMAYAPVGLLASMGVLWVVRTVWLRFRLRRKAMLSAPQSRPAERAGGV